MKYFIIYLYLEIYIYVKMACLYAKHLLLKQLDKLRK